MKRFFNLETQEWEEDDAPELDALGYLQSIYRDPGQPETRRLKAAIEALPFEKPKLAAVATIQAEGDFAARLDRAIMASRVAPRLIEGIALQEGSPKGRSAEAVSGKSFAPLRRRF